MLKAVVVFHMYSSAQNLEACAGICCRVGTRIGNFMSAPQHCDMNGSRRLHHFKLVSKPMDFSFCFRL